MTHVDVHPIRTLLILVSYHHRNTEKVARAMAEVLDARIMSPPEVGPAEIQACDLIGFGSGIYDGMHHRSLLDLAERLPEAKGKPGFLFSTSAIINQDKVAKDHSALRERLRQKGYEVVDEFACRGLDTNSFLKYIGGLNKGRPSGEDLEHAAEFAHNLLKKGGSRISRSP